MINNKGLFGRRKTGYDSGTFQSAAGALAITLVFAIYNGFLGMRHASLWHGTICAYYIILVILRGTIIIADRMIPRSKDKDVSVNTVYQKISFLLLILNCSLVLPVSLMVMQKTPVSMTLTPAIAIAVYTTYKVAKASVNLVRRRISANNLARLLRTITFIDALVSILTLQNTLIIAASDGDGLKLMPLTAISSFVVWAVILLLSAGEIRNGIRQRNSRK